MKLYKYKVRVARKVGAWGLEVKGSHTGYILARYPSEAKAKVIAHYRSGVETIISITTEQTDIIELK